MPGLHAGAFQLAEVDLAALLPEETLAPFAEELQGRDRRRERRIKVGRMFSAVLSFKKASDEP